MNRNFKIYNDIYPTALLVKDIAKLPYINTQLHPIPPLTKGIYYDTHIQKVVYIKDSSWKVLLTEN